MKVMGRRSVKTVDVRGGRHAPRELPGHAPRRSAPNDHAITSAYEAERTRHRTLDQLAGHERECRFGLTASLRRDCCFAGEQGRCARAAPAPARSLLEGEAGAGVHHRRPPGVDGGDDLLVVDPSRWVPVGERCEWPSWRWISGSGIPSCISSTACAWRSWWGGNLRLSPALSAS